MKSLAMITVIALAITMGACGGGSSASHTTSANGTWTETLSSATAQPLGSFTYSITQNNSALTGGNLNFANMGQLDQCFGAGTVMSGQMGQGMMNGGNMGMSMTMSWTAPDNAGTNTMTMQGGMGMSMQSGSGTFVLTGESPGCMSQEGTFTMTHM
jgi:hypothetical protein